MRLNLTETVLLVNIQYFAFSPKNIRWPSILAKRLVSAKNQIGALRLKKLHSVEKTKGTLWPPSTFERIKNFGLVRDSNTRTPASGTSENPGIPLCQVAVRRYKLIWFQNLNGFIEP